MKKNLLQMDTCWVFIIMIFFMSKAFILIVFPIFYRVTKSYLLKCKISGLLALKSWMNKKPNPERRATNNMRLDWIID